MILFCALAFITTHHPRNIKKKKRRFFLNPDHIESVTCYLLEVDGEKTEAFDVQTGSDLLLCISKDLQVVFGSQEKP